MEITLSMKSQTINNYINRCVIPFKDIFTTVYTVKTEEGYLLFDTATYDSDVDGIIVPMLEELGITTENLKYIFISHDHGDHSGGLERLLDYYPSVTVIARSPAISERFPNAHVRCPEDMEKINDSLIAVTIPGHTMDSCAVYDTRTKTLITGDCLQLYGIFGSDDWGSHIRFPAEHIEAVNKLLKINVEGIYTAHDFHPYGYAYIGREAIEKALDAAVRPLIAMKKMIEENPTMTDSEIRTAYNTSANIPRVREAVFRAVREAKI